MRRRDFIFAGAATSALSLSAHAQDRERVRRIAVLAPFNTNDPAGLVFLDAFRQRLVELGWTDGRNVSISYRFTGGFPENTRTAVADFVATMPDVIFAASNVSVGPLLQATKTIPIVFTQVSDPVGSGFVASAARPGGNITGFQGYEPAIGGKWLEVLKETAPQLRRAAVLYNPKVTANVAFL